MNLPLITADDIDCPPAPPSQRPGRLVTPDAPLAQAQGAPLDPPLAARSVTELLQLVETLQDQLRVQSTHDALTGLWNRGATLELLKKAHARARREGQALCLMVMDIDHFKRINDRHGHPAGDQVLKTVAHRLAQSLRANDAIGRIGSEEFLCVLDACNIDQALGVAERCRDLVRRAPIELVGDYVSTLSVTVSIGLAVVSRPEDLTVDGAILRADAALAQAREAGRDRVALAPD